MPMNNPANTQSPTQSATSKATSAIQEGGARAVQLGERLEEGAESLASSAIARVRDVREQAESTLEQQRSMLATRVRKFGGVLRASGSLSTEDQLAQQLLESASGRVERVAAYIDRANPESVVRDLNRFARGNPGWFFGGAFVLGLAAGRFLKSSGSKSSGSAQADSDAQSEPAPRGPTERSAGSPRAPSAARGSGSASQEPAYGASEAAGSRSGPPPTSSSTGSAAGSGVTYSAPSASSPPKPQPSGASASPRPVEPGEGNKT